MPDEEPMPEEPPIPDELGEVVEPEDIEPELPVLPEPLDMVPLSRDDVPDEEPIEPEPFEPIEPHAASASAQLRGNSHLVI